MTVWAVAVVVGAGLTLVLQEDDRPQGPYVWDDGHGAGPPPGDGRSCPPSPQADPAAVAGHAAVLCFYATTAP